MKSEGDKVGKQLVIVTQDEVGSSMAERCGIEVRGSLDGLDGAIMVDEEFVADDAQDTSVIAPILNKKKEIRLSEVGSNDFYDIKKEGDKNILNLSKPSIPTNATSVVSNTISGKIRRPEVLNMKALQPILNNPILSAPGIEKKSSININDEYGKNLDNKKEETLERMYSQKNEHEAVAREKTDAESGKIKKIFLGFIFLCLFSFVGVAAYLFLPSANISIEPNIIKDKLNIELSGGNDVADSGKVLIPIRIVEKEEKNTLSYGVDGAASNGKKAHGSVIYNEYDSSPQTLIATTRLETGDGKIFRIAKNVVVPGMSTISGEKKAGAISVDIIADQPGESYNIESGEFTIPGFKDSPKYTKFYAKSTDPLTGGSIDSQSAGGVISQKDIDNAKLKTEEASKSKIVQSAKGELTDGEILIEQAEKITIIKSLQLLRLSNE